MSRKKREKAELKHMNAQDSRASKEYYMRMGINPYTLKPLPKTRHTEVLNTVSERNA